MSVVFINYRTADTAMEAQVIHTKLAKRLGPHAVFRDASTIPPGIDYRDNLWSHLKTSLVMLVLVGHHWFEEDETGIAKISKEDDFVRQEIECGLKRNMRVIPVIVGRARLKGLPESIADLEHREYVQVRDRDSLSDIERLCNLVVKIVGGPDDSAGPGRPGPTCPTGPTGPRTQTISDVHVSKGALTAGDCSPASNQVHEGPGAQ